ncbi:MAG: ADP-glucose pyrophosphorylase [Rhodobacterales bacterium]|nr:MAG: ADP-glucose pyrophosphorylase [Rhodobacterales bacterium]
MRSGLPRLLVATQYRPETLEAHLDRLWAPLFADRNLQIRNGALVRGQGGYGGTADAVATNRALIDAAAPDEVLVLSADHIYQMDYSAMIAAHRASGASVTVGVHHVPVHQATGFGVLEAGPDGSVIRFAEKPAHPAEDPAKPGHSMASMGIYVFDWAWLRAALPVGASACDFGHDILPAAVAAGVVSAFALPALPGQTAPYWRDVGTLDSLRSTLLEFAATAPCRLPVLPGPPFLASGMYGHVARPAGPANPAGSVILPGAHVDASARLQRAIVAPGTYVPPNLVVGEDAQEDARWFRRTRDGTVLVTNAMLAQRAGRALPNLTGPLLRAYDLPLAAC